MLHHRHNHCSSVHRTMGFVFGHPAASGVTRNFVREVGGVQRIQLRTEDRERGSGGGSPLVRGSGGSCNLVQEISFNIVKFS